MMEESDQEMFHLNKLGGSGSLGPWTRGKNHPEAQ